MYQTEDISWRLNGVQKKWLISRLLTQSGHPRKHPNTGLLSFNCSTEKDTLTNYPLDKKKKKNHQLLVHQLCSLQTKFSTNISKLLQTQCLEFHPCPVYHILRKWGSASYASISSTGISLTAHNLRANT